MKANITARLDHHLERKKHKEDKRGRDTRIPFTEEARAMLDPWYDALFSSTIKPYPNSDKQRTAENVWYKVLGDCLATCGRQELTHAGGLNITSQPLNEVNVECAKCMIALLKEEGITLD